MEVHPTYSSLNKYFSRLSISFDILFVARFRLCLQLHEVPHVLNDNLIEYN